MPDKIRIPMPTWIKAPLVKSHEQPHIYFSSFHDPYIDLSKKLLQLELCLCQSQTVSIELH